MDSTPTTNTPDLLPEVEVDPNATQPGTFPENNSASPEQGTAPQGVVRTGDLERHENSQLGRKVAALNGDLTHIKDTLNQLLQQRQPSQTQPEVSEFDDFDPALATRQELDAYLDRRESTRRQQQAAQQSQYQGAYIAELASKSSGLSAAEYSAFEDSLQKINVQKTGDARIDAELVFQTARAAMYQNQISKPNVPSPATPPPASFGGPSPTTPPNTPNGQVKLDPDTANLASQLGFSDQELAEMFKG